MTLFAPSDIVCPTWKAGDRSEVHTGNLADLSATPALKSDEVNGTTCPQLSAPAQSRGLPEHSASRNWGFPQLAKSPTDPKGARLCSRERANGSEGRP